MHAMVLRQPGQPLQWEARPDPDPSRGEVRLRVQACAVCRTDLHVVDGELPVPRLPLVPGHEIVGIVDAVGADVDRPRLGERVGVPWLGHTCGHCAFCGMGRENLCDHPVFTGHGRNGGFATHVLAEAAFSLPLGGLKQDALHAAPLLCAGLIGWRCLRKAGASARRLGLYGFGAAAHLIAQIALQEGREVYAFTRPGDTAGQAFARQLGVTWAGPSDERPPKPLDAAIIFAPVGSLVPLALEAVRKGGRVVCGGIHMSDIPALPYQTLWHERELVSVANLTRADADEFLGVAARLALDVRAVPYRLDQANQALADLRSGALQGAAVLMP
jgi:propanol-preferring alcohol dehydrogenase